MTDVQFGSYVEGFKAGEQSKQEIIDELCETLQMIFDEKWGDIDFDMFKQIETVLAKARGENQ